MPFPLLIPAITAGASLIGGLFKKKQTQASTSTMAPTLDPAFGPLQSTIMNQVMARLKGGGPDLSGYAGSGVADINHTFDLIKQSQGNNLTARGLASSPVAGVVDANRDMARGGEIARFQNSLPLLSRELQNQDLGFAANFLNAGRGTTSTSTGSATGGGGLAGGFENLAGMLGYLISTGKLGGNGLPGYSSGPH